MGVEGWLNIALMHGQIDGVMTAVTFAIPATMGVFFIHFVVGMALGTRFKFLTRSFSTVELKTIRSIKMAITVRTNNRWRGLTMIVRARLACVSVAGAAGATLTWMFFFGTLVKATVAFVTPIALVHERAKTGATLIMVVALDEHDLMRSIWPTVDDKKRFGSARDFELVPRGENALKPIQFFPGTGSFGDASELIKFTGLHRLSRSAMSKGTPIVGTHGTWIIPMTPGPHGDDGSGTTQVVLVVDGNDTPFALVIPIYGSPPHLESFSVAAPSTENE